MKTFRFGQRSKDNIYGNNTQPPINEKLQRVVERALIESTVDFTVISGYRTAEQQNALFKKDVSTLDGYEKKSYHQTGYAVDIMPIVKDSDGNKLPPFDTSNTTCLLAWHEVIRAFLRAGFKLGIHVTAGWVFNIGSGRDLGHFQIARG